MNRSAVAALATVCLAVGLAHSARASECYDVSKGEPRTLTGTLDYVIFPGPPHFMDVKGGDAPEPNYVLRLPGPICLTGDDFADPSKPFTSVQVLEAEVGRLREFLHRTVTLTLKGPLAAETGHHHEPLVAWVTSAQLADPPPTEQLVEYGTAVATVRDFYSALGQGNGQVAALLVAPEQRTVPAFSSSAMSAFYGNLREPIHLLALERSGADTFVVQYRYAALSRVCDGKALVTTRSRARAIYIENIKALDGC